MTTAFGEYIAITWCFLHKKL